MDLGASFDAADYDGGTLFANVGTLSVTADPGYKTIDVTSQVRSNVAAASSRSSHRLRFSLMDSDNDGSSDWTMFTVDSSAGYGPPQLVLTVAP